MRCSTIYCRIHLTGEDRNLPPQSLTPPIIFDRPPQICLLLNVVRLTLSVFFIVVTWYFFRRHTIPPKALMSRFSRLCPNTRFCFYAQPNRRDNVAFASRRDAARRERDGTGTVCQINNGETDLATMFHKSLPHDGLGQVLYKSYTPSASHFGGVTRWIQVLPSRLLVNKKPKLH